MAHDEDDDWGSSTGFVLDGEDVRVLSAEFRVANELGSDAMALELEFLLLSDEHEGETKTQLFSIGKGWTIADKGAEITGMKKISGQSNYGIWKDHALQLDGAKETLASRGTQREAAVWVDTLWTIGTAKVGGRTNPATGEVKESTVFVPVAFNGVADEGKGKGGGGSKSASKPAGKTAATKAEKPAAVEVDEDTLATLTKLAAKTVAKGGSHADFVDAALDVDGVATNKAAMQLVSKKSAIWADAGGE